jgi:hypothetical protein
MQSVWLAPSVVLARGSRVRYRLQTLPHGGGMCALDLYVPWDSANGRALCADVLRAKKAVRNGTKWSNDASHNGAGGGSISAPMWHHSAADMCEAAWSDLMCRPTLCRPCPEAPRVHKMGKMSEAQPVVSGRGSGRYQQRRAAEQRRAHVQAKRHAMHDPISAL